jgi:hypothetical protein
VLGWFRKRRTPLATTEIIASQPPGEVFPWPRDTTLTALDEAVLALPKAILGPSEVIASVIRGDDDMQISIPEQGERLLLRLRPGMSVSLSKSSQACVVSDDGQPRRFRISGPPLKPDA